MSWQRIRGHEAQVDAFDRAYRAGRLGHAFLFTGPPGVGKHLFATELAKAILCETPSEHLTACDHCTSCTLFDGDTHPDFFAVARPEDKNELPVELMKQLCIDFSMKTARGRGKVAILDDADDLNDESSNCFLKTLEEPPPRSLFILVSSTGDRQLATISSRCQLVRFAPLPDALVQELLEMNEEIDKKLIPRLVALSEGSPGKSVALADAALWEFRQKLLQQIAQPRLDTVALSRDWMRFAEEAGKETAAQRRRSALILKLLIAFLRDALTVKLHGQIRGADAADERLLQALTSRLDEETLLALLDRCLEADGQIERYVQLVLVIEGLLDTVGRILRR